MSQEDGNIESNENLSEDAEIAFRSSSNSPTSCESESDDGFDVQSEAKHGWQPSRVNRTVVVDSSQLAEGEYESPPIESYSITDSSKVPNDGDENEVQMKGIDPIPLRNNSTVPLLDFWRHQGQPMKGFFDADSMRRDAVPFADHLDQRHLGSMGIMSGPTSRPVAQPYHFQHVNSSQVPTPGGSMHQHIMGASNNPLLFNWQVGMPQLGFSANVQNHPFYSIPGNNFFPWSQAQAHPFMNGFVTPSPLPSAPSGNLQLNNEATVPVGQFGGLGLSRDTPQISGIHDSIHKTSSVCETTSDKNTTETSRMVSTLQPKQCDLASANRKKAGLTTSRRQKEPFIIPHSRDVCFAWIKHSGTRVWRTLVDSLAVQADVDWSNELCNLIKDQIEQEGRRFLVCINAKGFGVSSKVLKNKPWRLADDNEIWQRTRQRFRDCRKAKGVVSDAKRECKRKHDSKSRNVSTKNSPEIPVDLSAVFIAAIAQCQTLCDERAAIVSSIDQRNIKAERAHERLELLLPLANLRWSHVLESEVQQRPSRLNVGGDNNAVLELDLSVVMEKGRLNHRIKKLKKAESHMVNFIQTLMESDCDQLGSSERGSSDSDETSMNNSAEGDDSFDDDEEGDDGGTRGDKQDNDESHDSDETESDQEMENDCDKNTRKNSSSRNTTNSRYDLVTVFQAAPLAYRLKSGDVHPLPLLDIDYERTVLTESLKSGSQYNIDIDFEVATVGFLGDFLKRSEGRVLHLSCHGHPDYMALDNGWGGMQILRVQELEHFFRFGAGNLDLVFLSSCDSRPAGEVVVAAGVPHVVCCYQNHRPRDVVAIEFARSFYRALACGETLKVAFDMARQSVQEVAGNSLSEHEQFVLLPEKDKDDPYHNVHIFLQRNQRPPVSTNLRTPSATSFPSLPRPSKGLSLHMFFALEQLSKFDVVRIVGAADGQRLISALAGYVSGRTHSMNIDVMVCLPPLKGAVDEVSHFLRRICKVILDDAPVPVEKLTGKGSKYRSYLNEALSYLVGKRCLFVINGRKRLGAGMQALRLERLIGDILAESYSKIVLGCGDNHNLFNGPPELSEQIYTYDVSKVDRDVPLETTIIHGPDDRVIGKRNKSNNLDEKDDESVSDLSTNSKPRETRSTTEQRKQDPSKLSSDKDPFGVREEAIEVVKPILDSNVNKENQSAKDKIDKVPSPDAKPASSNNTTDSSAHGGPTTGKSFDAEGAPVTNVSATTSQRPSYVDSSGTDGTSFLKRNFTQGYRSDARGRSCLYGRDKEISIVRDAYLRITVPGAPSEIVVVHGASGTGKSTLVKHIDEMFFVGKKGIFAVGKFDEIRSSAKPYMALVDALSRLSVDIANGNELEVVRSTLKDDLGSETEILAALIPTISKLSGETTATSVVNASFAKGYAFTRLKDVFRKFLKAVSSPDRPILLFFDDVQWADNASYELMESLAMDPDSKNILFVWAYRDNDSGAEAPKSAVSRIKEKSTLRLSDIAIGAVDSRSLEQMLAHLAECGHEKVKPLSALLSRKTGGNIYFVLEFLHMLQQEGLMVFSEELKKWEWDIAVIETQTVVSENVADLLTSKLSRQPKTVQVILQLAACFGFFFDVKVLESVARAEGVLNEDSRTESDHFNGSNTELWSGELVQILMLAKRENLVVQTMDPSIFKFPHDIVRQCAYDLMQEKEKREQLHLRIGMLIWTQIDPKKADEALLLLAVDQVNRGCHHAKDEATRTKLATLNLECATRACKKMAYFKSTELLDRAISLLNPKTKWLATYDLCLELYSASAEMECSIGNFEKSDERVNAIKSRACSFTDMLRAHLVWLDSMGIRRRFSEAIEEGMKILRNLGETIPRRQGVVKILLEANKTKRRIKGSPEEQIQNLGQMSNDRKIAAMRLLSAMALLAWHSDRKDLLTFVVLRMTSLTLTYGLCMYSPFAFAAFGMILGAFGETKEAYKFGSIGLQLLETADTKECSCSTRLVVLAFVEHLKQPLSTIATRLKEAHEIGMANGEIQYACLTLSTLGCLLAVTGKPLRTLISDLQRQRRMFKAYKQGYSDIVVATWLQFSLNLSGQSQNAKVLTGEALSETSFLDQANTMAKLIFHFIKMVLLYHLGEYEAASVELDELERRKERPEGTHFLTAFIHTYSGLVSLAMAKKRRRFLTKGQKYINQISTYVKGNRVNCPPLLSLLQAVEMSAFAERGAKGKVKKAFDDAIAANSNIGFLPFEAIANELAGEYMLTRDDESLGRAHLERAIRLYSDWDAVTKVQLLEAKYQSILSTDPSNTVL